MPAQHFFELGEVVAVVGRVNLGGEQGDSLRGERVGIHTGLPADGTFDRRRVAAGVLRVLVYQIAFLTERLQVGKRVPDVGVLADQRQDPAFTGAPDKDGNVAHGPGTS